MTKDIFNEAIAVNWKNNRRYTSYLKLIATRFKLGTGYKEFKVPGTEFYVVRFGPSTNKLVRGKYVYLGLDFQTSGRAKFGWINSFAVTEQELTGFKVDNRIFKSSTLDFKPIPKDFVKMEQVMSLIIGAGVDFDNDKTKITPALVAGTAQPEKQIFDINKRFEFMATMVRLIAFKTLPGMIIVGTGGVGKTYTVVSTLKDCGLLEDEDYIHIHGSKVTNVTFYKTLYDNRDRLIIFDDSDSVLDDGDRINMLKSALDTTGEDRTVSYNSPAIEAMDLPTKFVFTGQIIFISNRSMKAFDQPLISRSLPVDVEMTRDETFQRMQHIVGLEKNQEEKQLKLDALEIIKKFSEETNGNRPKDLNMRTLYKVTKILKATPDRSEAEELISYILSVS